MINLPNSAINNVEISNKKFSREVEKFSRCSIMTICKYFLGTCYGCQKCLYCFKLPQRRLCKCKKDNQPSRVSKPERGQQIYQRAFNPNEPLQIANEFLFTANVKFNYNSNFEEKFSYTFCTSCNSKFQRLRTKNKKKLGGKNKKPQIQDKSDKESNDSENDNNSKEDDGEKGDDGEKSDDGEKGDDNEKEDDSEKGDDSENEDNSEEDTSEEKNNSIEEVKVQLTIKNKDKKTPTAKTLTIQPVNYKNVMERINSMIHKALGKRVKSTNYTISYKAVNARGPANELEDEADFQEFLDEYRKVILVGKKMSVIVVIKDDIMKKCFGKKHTKVNIFYVS